MREFEWDLSIRISSSCLAGAHRHRDGELAIRPDAVDVRLGHYTGLLWLELNVAL